MPISLLKTKEKHLLITFRWANEKKLIKNSLKRKKISFKDHQIWFIKILNSKNKIMKIIYLNKIPIGLIRLDKKYDNYYLSYLIEKKFRGRGYAFLALSKFIKNIKKFAKIKKISALVKKNNIPSVKIFNKLNFVLIYKKKNILKYSYKI